MTRDEQLMQVAIDEAKKAAAEGEIPVGAAIYRRNELVSAAHNRRENDRDPLGHAELAAISAAARAINDWRLDECELFVTLEPCAMCSGAIVASRLRRVVFGAFDPESGYCISKADLHRFPGALTAELIGGVRESECAALLSEFFKNKRK